MQQEVRDMKEVLALMHEGNKKLMQEMGSIMKELKDLQK